MRQVFGGAALVIAGIAAFIEAHAHEPGSYVGWGPGLTAPYGLHRVGLSNTAHDLLRIGAWALVIVGALLVVTGLMRYWAAQARP
jgi:hypothetical protein